VQLEGRRTSGGQDEDRPATPTEPRATPAGPVQQSGTDISVSDTLLLTTSNARSGRENKATHTASAVRHPDL